MAFKRRLPSNPFGGLSTQRMREASPRESKVIPSKWMMTSDLPPSELDESASPYINNFMWDKGALAKRPGLKSVGGALNAAVLGGGLFHLRSGSNYAIALTKSKVYYLVGSTWTEITGGTGASLTSDDYHPFSTAVWPFTDRFCFSQGVDQVQYLPSTVASYEDLSASAPPAYVVRVFNNRLNLFRTYESSDLKAQRHRYCINGDITDWTGVGSGYKDLNDNDDYVINALRLGSAMFVYKERSITRMIATGYAATPFQYDQAWVRERGIFGARCVASNGTIHAGIFTDGILTYDGSQFKSIAFGRIESRLMSQFNHARLGMAIVHYLPSLRSFVFGIPVADENFSSIFYIFHEPTQSWTTFTFHKDVTSIFDYSAATGTTIDSIAETIDSQTYAFDSVFSQLRSGLFLLGMSDGTIYNIDEQSKDDGTTAIPLEWQSKDYGIDGPLNLTTISGLGIEYQDLGPATLVVEYSTNGGTSWAAGSSVPIGGTVDRSTKIAWAWFTVTGSKVRYRIRNVDTGSEVRITALHPIVAKGGDNF